MDIDNRVGIVCRTRCSLYSGSSELECLPVLSYLQKLFNLQLSTNFLPDHMEFYPIYAHLSCQSVTLKNPYKDILSSLPTQLSLFTFLIYKFQLPKPSQTLISVSSPQWGHCALFWFIFHLQWYGKCPHAESWATAGLTSFVSLLTWITDLHWLLSNYWKFVYFVQFSSC